VAIRKAYPPFLRKNIRKPMENQNSNDYGPLPRLISRVDVFFKPKKDM
jgi:hypothetical protein